MSDTIRDMATDLAQAIEVPVGGARYYQITGCLNELLEKCVKAIYDAGGDNADFHANYMHKELTGEY